MASSNKVRAIFVVLILLFGFVPAYSYATTANEDRSLRDEYREQAGLPFEERTQLVPPRDDITVVSNNLGPLVAYAPDGRLLYYDNRYLDYWSVDPVPEEGSTTVMYAATQKFDASECPVDAECTKNIVEQVNLTTGDVERLYTRYRAGKFDNEWHDVDRINDTHLLIADMDRDQVSIVNTSNGIIEWTWDAQSDFPITSGGESSDPYTKGYPEDWTHLNDVEQLENGLIMVSLRNQDQVVFIDRREGLVEEMTLGADDEYDIMFEQHQPDYITEENGGPAVVIADSQNNRLVEYQRTDGSWEETWAWTDEEMLWPRDADRLPDGNTLVTDTNSRRVFEVDRQGEVEWLVNLPPQYRPYEAERLGTGIESAGGPSAMAAELQSRGDATARDAPINPKYEDSTVHAVVTWLTTELRSFTKQAVPNRLLNGLLFVLPPWVRISDLIPLALLGLTLLSWGIFELYTYQRSLDIAIRSPVTFGRREQ